MQVFFATLDQTVFLFALITVGFVLAKLKFLPQDSAKTLSKLENCVFIPALVMGTFMQNFTVERISVSWKLLLIGFGVNAVMIPLAIIIAKIVTKDKYIQKIYTYGLAFSNFGFMGNAVVAALFPDIFFEYLLFVMPSWIMIYLWGVPSLLITDAERKQSAKDRLKALVNPMFIAMAIGAIIGISGIDMPNWITSAVDTAGSCMSPIAMILTGITVANADLKKIFTNIRIYLISAIRLLAIPLIFIGISHLIPFSNAEFICTLASLAMPLGLNTIVVPGAYGRDTTVASGMAVISHLLACVTIPFIFYLAS